MGHPEESESPPDLPGRKPLISPRLSIILIGGVAIGLIVLMCVAVGVIAYYRS